MQEAAFLEIAKYLKENDEEQITLTDLTNMMGKICSDATSVEGYSNICMKKRLIEHFKDEISITNIDFYGRSNIATDDIEQQKYCIIEATARIIKNDIKCLPPDNSYPSLEELRSIPKYIEYLPSSLHLLLENVFLSKNSGKHLAFIGQSIMQQACPRALIMPLQVGVAIQMHHHFSSRYLRFSKFNGFFIIVH